MLMVGSPSLSSLFNPTSGSWSPAWSSLKRLSQEDHGSRSVVGDHLQQDSKAILHTRHPLPTVELGRRTQLLTTPLA